MPNRDIGIDVPAPAREPAPGDRLNPFNGSLPVRGSVIVGTVVSSKMQGTCVVEKAHRRAVQKFERIETRTRRYPAHVPSNLDVHVGDQVVIAECRPISKTVNFVVVENRGNPAEAKSRAAAPAPARPAPAPRPAAARAPREAAAKDAKDTGKEAREARPAKESKAPRKKAEPKGETPAKEE